MAANVMNVSNLLAGVRRQARARRRVVPRRRGAGCYGLVGANGAGKTTLIKHLFGLLRAKSGSVRVFRLDQIRDLVDVLSRVGYLSEERELPEWMRIDELMRYTQAFHPNWDMAYARELLDTFALDPYRKRSRTCPRACARRPAWYRCGGRPSSGAARP